MLLSGLLQTERENLDKLSHILLYRPCRCMVMVILQTHYLNPEFPDVSLPTPQTTRRQCNAPRPGTNKKHMANGE